jgi:hypothetical protein
MFTEYKYYIVAIAFAIYSFGVWHVATRYTGFGYEKEKAQDIADYLEKQQGLQAAADKLGLALAQSEARNKQLQFKINKEVSDEVKKPVYSECRATDDGVRIIEEAINGYTASGK